MEQYILDWLNVIFRWVHIITGIAWIGSSFYFMWLDYSLIKKENADENEMGEVFSVHGGGFYHSQKYKVMNPLPEPLHWFKWESYFTWISGISLLIIVYYLQAEAILIDKEKMDISSSMAFFIGIGYLVIGWIIYDLLCKSPFGKNPLLVSGIVFALLILSAYSLSLVFTNRGVYIHIGAMMGTIMTANVFFVIIPNQKKMVQAVANKQPIDVSLGARGKIRSMHNNYFTLPVLFIMVSNHYPFIYERGDSWAVLAIISISCILVRHYFNLANLGRKSIIPMILAIIIFISIVIYMSPKSTKTQDKKIARDVKFYQINRIIQSKCSTCHSMTPDKIRGLPSAPKGIVLDTPEDIQKNAKQIYLTTVVQKIMPLANITNISEEERDMIKIWIEKGGKIQ